MMALHSCPRCKGAVMEHGQTAPESAVCINCGWRRAEIPEDVIAQVEAHLGQPYMEDRYAHSRIGTGKPPLSGWERVKRRRERERARQQVHTLAAPAVAERATA